MDSLTATIKKPVSLDVWYSRNFSYQGVNKSTYFNTITIIRNIIPAQLYMERLIPHIELGDIINVVGSNLVGTTFFPIVDLVINDKINLYLKFDGKLWHVIVFSGVELLVADRLTFSINQDLDDLFFKGFDSMIYCGNYCDSKKFFGFRAELEHLMEFLSLIRPSRR